MSKSTLSSNYRTQRSSREFEVAQALIVLCAVLWTIDFPYFLFESVFASGPLQDTGVPQLFEAGLVVLIISGILFLHCWIRKRFAIRKRKSSPCPNRSDQME